MGDGYTNTDFEIKKMLFSLASEGRDEAQASCLVQTGITQLINRLNRKVILIHTNLIH